MEFQSTLPHRERRALGKVSHDQIKFQSTLPHRERQRGGMNAASTSLFQSTLPHRERLLLRYSYFVFLHYFNPRSRIGSDCKTANYFLKIPFTFIYILHIFYSTHFFSKTEFRFSTKFQCEYPCIFNITSVSHLSILITTAPSYILT